MRGATRFAGDHSEEKLLARERGGEGLLQLGEKIEDALAKKKSEE